MQATERSPVLLRIHHTLKIEAVKAARRECRSLNNYLERLIQRDLDIELPEEKACDIGFPEATP
jgi:hypothetical protein